MFKELKRYAGRQVHIIYWDRKGAMTQRRIWIQTVDDMLLCAYCCERKAPRVFAVNRVLAVFPAYGEAVSSRK